MWHYSHYGKFAVGGAGLIVVEMTSVLPNGRITPCCSGLWNDEQADLMRPVVDFAHSQARSPICEMVAY